MGFRIENGIRHVSVYPFPLFFQGSGIHHSFFGSVKDVCVHLPPPPESEIELWIPKSMVDTQNPETTGKSHLSCPEGPGIKQIHSRSNAWKNHSPTHEMFILACNFHSRFGTFILDWKVQSQALSFCSQVWFKLMIYLLFFPCFIVFSGPRMV